MQSNKFDIKKIVSYLGTLLMLVSLGFIARRLITSGIDFSLLTSGWVVAGLLGVAMVEGLGIIGAGFNYRAAIFNVSGIKVSATLGLLVYAAANMYKYIPGGVMYVLGRNRLAVETDGLGHSKVALATVLEGATIAMGAIAVTMIFSFEHAAYYVRQLQILPMILLVLAIVLVAIALAVYFNRSKIIPKFEQLWDAMESPIAGVIAKRFAFAFAIMFLWGGSFVAVLAIMGQPMTISVAASILGLYLLAWVTGFLTPGAPSGLGVREAAMLLMIGGMVDESVLLAAMVMHRVLTVLGDVMAYVFALGVARGMKRIPMYGRSE